MNVRCPSCETLYRVDPAKVPEQGVQARCAECPAVISVIHSSEDLSAVPSSEATDTGVGTDTFVPPPLADVEQVDDSLVEPTEPIGESAPADDTLASAALGTDLIDEPSPIEATQPVLPHEFADDERPPLPDEPVVEDDLPLPDVTAPTEAVVPLPALEPAVSEEPVADEIPPLPEVPSPVEAVADVVPPVEEFPPVEELPPVPDISEAPEPADIEIPAPEPESTRPPALEVMPSAKIPPSGQPRRYTRPFLRPPEAVAPSPPPVPSGPMRPTAPVFHPTPGMPIQTPPAPEPIVPVDAAPAPPPVSEPSTQVPAPQHQPDAAVAPEPKPRRPVNPFLSKDPRQKARRLARALVSDMIVYQPQKRQDALAAGTLKDAFDGEIKKSWEEYVDQIGNELATQTDFFKEALNEILAGGNEIF